MNELMKLKKLNLGKETSRGQRLVANEFDYSVCEQWKANGRDSNP